MVWPTFFRHIIVSYIRGRRLSNRRHIFGKRTHFQLSCITQKRLWLSSVIIGESGYRWGGVGRGGLNALQIGPFKNAISRRKKVFSSASQTFKQELSTKHIMRKHVILFHIPIHESFSRPHSVSLCRLHDDPNGEHALSLRQ